MNLSQLYYFKKLAELMHYTNAAKELNISQPTLSAAISSLESELGVQLFQKDGRNIKLTKPGEKFFSSTCDFIDRLEAGISSVKEAGGSSEGRIEVGCITPILGDFVPAVISRFHNDTKYHTNIITFEASTAEIIDGVRTGQYDIGFCSKTGNETGLTFVPVLSQPIIALVNSRCPLAERRELYLKDLKGYTVITYRKDLPIGWEMENLVMHLGLDVQYRLMGESAIGGFVASRSAVGLVAETAQLAEYPELIHIPLRDVPKNYRLVYMVYHQKSYLSAPVRRFIDFMSAYAEHLLGPDE